MAPLGNSSTLAEKGVVTGEKVTKRKNGVGSMWVHKKNEGSSIRRKIRRTKRGGAVRFTKREVPRARLGEFWWRGGRVSRWKKGSLGNLPGGGPVWGKRS